MSGITDYGGTHYYNVTETYKAKFGDVPMLFLLQGDDLDAALKMLEQAIRLDMPYTDEELYEALGIPLPPKDVDT